MDIFTEALETFKSNNREDLTVFSTIPEKCKTGRCYVGIDEAGRGPVLGPMVYGIFCCVADEDAISKKLKNGDDMNKIEENPPVLLDQISKLNDSKQLTEKVREEILGQIADLDYIAYGLKFISPTEISSKCYRRQKVSLNDVSHDAAIELIQGLVDRGVKIEKIYVDTVGPMEKYQKKLEEIFPELKFKVDKKADAKYKPVSAASVCAKVARDRALLGWEFPSGRQIKMGTKGWGSGYPGDDVTKTFLRQNIDVVFGFPNIVRNSWSTADKLLETSAVKIKWEREDADEASAPKISKYFSKAKNNENSTLSNEGAVLKKSKAQFFSYRELQQTVEL